MDLSRLGRTEQVLVSAGLLLFIFSFLPWFGVSDGLATFHSDAWSWPSGFNDWFPIVLLFLYAIVLALPAFGVLVPAPVLARPANRAFIGLVLSAFAVLMFAIQGLTYPGGGLGFSAGPSWAYYLSLVVALAAGAQSYLGFTRQGGSFAQVGAAFQARTQAVRQQDPQQPPYQPQPSYQPPYQQPQYGGAPQDPAAPPHAQPSAPPQQPPPQPPQPPQTPYGS